MRPTLILPLLLIALIATHSSDGHAKRVGARSSGTKHTPAAKSEPESSGTTRLPSVTVRTELPGGAPEEVEVSVTYPIEEIVNTVEGIQAVIDEFSKGRLLAYKRLGIVN